MQYRQNILPEPLFEQPLSGFLRFDGVQIAGIQVSAALQLFQKLFCMAAVPQRCVKSGFAFLNPENLQNLVHHDRDMHASRRISLADDLLDFSLIFLRVVFFIFLFKAAWITAAVVCSSFMLFFHVFASIYWLWLPAVRARRRGTMLRLAATRASA